MSNIDKNGLTAGLIAVGLAFVAYVYLTCGAYPMHSWPPYIYEMHSWPWFYFKTPTYLQWLWW